MAEQVDDFDYQAAQHQDNMLLEQQLEAVILKVAQGESTKQDALFLCGVLRINCNFLTGESNADHG